MSKQQDPKAQLAAGVRAKPTASSQEGAREKPPQKAWLAVAIINRDGRRADPKNGALTIIAVSVHERCSVHVPDRIKLMHDIARCKQISPKVPSLWVFPAGYFGFDAAAYAHNDYANAWWNLNPREIEEKLTEIIEPFPVGAWIAFGVDYPGPDRQCMQEVWLIPRKQTDNGEWVKPKKIIRNSEPQNHCIDLDDQGFKAAFFVCDDVKNYSRENFKDCRLIVDLAHLRVKGLVNKAYVCDKDKRRVHQKALEAARFHSAAVLTHHHAGELIAERAKEAHQSNWIMFRADKPDWLDSKVEEFE